MNCSPWSPVLNVVGRTQGRFLRCAVCQASFPLAIPSKPVGSHAFHCLLMNTTHLPPHEHDDDAVSLFRPSHVHEPWLYVCASRRSRPRPYVRTWPYFISCTLAVVRACTCYVHASTTTRARSISTSMYVHVRDQNDNATYASTRWVPTVRHFLA